MFESEGKYAFGLRELCDLLCEIRDAIKDLSSETYSIWSKLDDINESILNKLQPVSMNEICNKINKKHEEMIGGIKDD